MRDNGSKEEIFKVQQDNKFGAQDNEMKKEEVINLQIFDMRLIIPKSDFPTVIPWFAHFLFDIIGLRFVFAEILCPE